VDFPTPAFLAPYNMGEVDLFFLPFAPWSMPFPGWLACLNIELSYVPEPRFPPLSRSIGKKRFRDDYSLIADCQGWQCIVFFRWVLLGCDWAMEEVARFFAFQ